MFFIFGVFKFANAEVVFSEIAWMGNSENINAEWFEIYNNGESEIDLSDWSISGLLSFEIPSGKTIPAGKYFIFGRQPVSGVYTYIPNFTPDLIYKGALSNSGGTLNLNDKNGNQKSSVTYDGKIGDNETKETMQWDGSKWFTASPTPGGGSISNNTEKVQDNNIGAENNTSNISTSSSSNEKSQVEYKIATKIISPKIVTAGVPFDVDHNTTGLKKEKIILGKFIWNFGDGRQKQLSVSDPFIYVYDYPGEYVLTLSYYDSNFDTKPDATDRVTIKVVPSGVVISSVGTSSDPYVEVENKSGYEMLLSGWVLKGSAHSFVVPDGMILLPNKKLKLSPKITGFDFNDLNFIEIVDQQGQVFTTYPNKKTNIYRYSENKNIDENIIKSNYIENKDIKEGKEIINLNDLSSSVGGANSGLDNKTLIYFGLAGIIIIGVLSIIFIRKKTDYPDYIEKEISASDMTIIE